MENQNYETEFGASQRIRNTRIRRLALAVAILLGLGAGAYELNEATRPVVQVEVPEGFTYNSTTKMGEKAVSEYFDPTGVSKESVSLLPNMGYTYIGGKYVKTTIYEVKPTFVKGPGIVDQAIDDISVLVKGR